MPSLARESPTSQRSQQRWLPFLGWMRHQPPVHRDAMAGLTGTVLMILQGGTDDLLAWLKPDVAARLTRATLLHNDQIHDNVITM
ncbi:hypothetical protein [Halomonas sp. M4R1S46]|uniref:hypothetical protein n=1 Tax=Halomonas sp. M4R1S46 TaxID=2982692 RepID=UPI0021E48D6C|nr:hypothetical protein [Halomonas sp. M4R1S46]UYG07044.1 hypothetical protein OCT48_15640 [Halomonas sp. M4R1S46]